MPQEDVTSPELQVRRAVLRRLLRGEPVDLTALSTSTGLRPHEVTQALAGLNFAARTGSHDIKRRAMNTNLEGS